MTAPTSEDEVFIGPLPEDVAGEDYPPCPLGYGGGVVGWRRMGNRLMDSDYHIHKPNQPGMEVVWTRNIPFP